MPIHKIPGGKYLLWYYDLQAKGRARKRAARPKRDILMVQTALKNLHLRYCQEVSFWNPLHVGKHGNLSGGLQWLDFVVKGKRRPFVFILDDPQKRFKEYEKTYLVAKKRELERRGVPYVLLKAGMTSQEYQILIYMNMKKKGV